VIVSTRTEAAAVAAWPAASALGVTVKLPPASRLIVTVPVLVHVA
jgi:hypothetical protein